MKTLGGCAALVILAAAGFAGSGPAHAQKAPAVADGTPGIDAAITQNNWSGALQQLDARIAAKPRDAQAQFKRATVLARLGRDDEAIAAFTALTQSFPELPEPYNNLAALYARRGRYDEARVTLETAVKANPQFALALQNLGDLYLQMAVRSYQQALKIDARNAYASERITQVEQIAAPHSMRNGGLIDPRRAAAARRDEPASAARAPTPGGASALPPAQFIPGAVQPPIR
jgi:tetratricopeptide (TPR) repeat protein